VRSVGFSPDGAQIVSGGDDGSVRLWDVASHQQVAQLDGHAGSVFSVGFSPDGAQIVSGGDDGTLRLWDGPQRVLLQAVARISRPAPVLTAAERQRFGIGRETELPDQEKLKLLMAQAQAWQLVAQGRVLARSGTLPEAAALFAQALRLDGSLGIDPETEAGRSYARVLVAEGNALARRGDVTGAIAKFEQALEVDLSLPIEPEAEAGRITAAVFVANGRSLAQQEDLAGAIAKFEQALALDPSLPIVPALLAQIELGKALLASDAYTEGLAALTFAQTISPTVDITTTLWAEDWNVICWDGSLDGLAAEVMPACERAVVLAPDDGGKRDSRGLARALAGDMAGAIEDFEFAVKSTEAPDLGAGFVESRTAWIAKLKAGENPFDEATLEQLR
jgi:tetratricopeptide (TPR) repeat protein